MFSNKYRYLIISLLAVYSYLNSLFSEVYTYYRIDVPWHTALVAFLLITLFVWEGNRLLQKVLLRYFTRVSQVSFLLIFFTAGVFISTLLSIAIVLGINFFFLQLPFSQIKLPLKLALTYGTRINLFLHILNAIVYFIRQYKSKQLEAEELKRINSQAQLQAIKNQVNPHFLFNNLNVLSSLVLLESKDANTFIEEFSKVYRHVLNAEKQELVTLEVELEFINPYIYLLQKRFPESIFVHIDIPPEYLLYSIIPVAVQMLVENAIKHNIASRQKPLRIFLSVDAKKRLTVMNNLQLKSVYDESTHIGLENIAKRYELITGKTIELKQTDSSFSVSLPLIQS